VSVNHGYYQSHQILYSRVRPSTDCHKFSIVSVFASPSVSALSVLLKVFSKCSSLLVFSPLPPCCLIVKCSNYYQQCSVAVLWNFIGTSLVRIIIDSAYNLYGILFSNQHNFQPNETCLPFAKDYYCSLESGALY